MRSDNDNPTPDESRLTPSEASMAAVSMSAKAGACVSLTEQRINRAILQSLRSLAQGAQPDPLPELIDLFLDDTPKRLLQMERSVVQRNSRNLEAAAHSLKGSAGSLGATLMVRLCARAMACAVAADFIGASAILNELRYEFGEVGQILTAEKSRPITASPPPQS